MKPTHSPCTGLQGVPLAGKVVVVLEDDELVRQATERLLRRLGAEVVSAGSSAEALGVLSDRGLVPTAVVADYWLNRDENGVAAIDSLQPAAEGAARGIVITGDTSSETAAEVAGRGFRLLRKPVDVDSFIDALTRPN